MLGQDLDGAPFRIVRRLGAGTSATVYEALHLERNQVVALKVFAREFIYDESILERVRGEAAALGRFRHPNIARLYKFWEVGENSFLELEYIDGLTLGSWMKSDNCPILEPRIWILAQTARALGALHEEGFVHRDLKPENVLVAKNGEIKLTDFGLVQLPGGGQTLTKAGFLIGSIAYMAPEIINGERASAASDVFSFGILAYELLTNEHPFGKLTPQSTLAAILEKKPPPPQTRNARISTKLSQLIMQCLATDPAARPSSIWDIEANLMNALVQSSLLAYAKGHLGVAPLGPPITLHQALTIKHALLKRRLDGLLFESQNGKSLDKAVFLAELNGFAILFPNDPELSRFLEFFKNEPLPKAKGYFRTKLAAACLFPALIGAFFFLQSRGRPNLVAHAQETKMISAAPNSAAPTTVAVVDPPSLPLLAEKPIQPAEVPVTQPATTTISPPRSSQSHDNSREASRDSGRDSGRGFGSGNSHNGGGDSDHGGNHASHRDASHFGRLKIAVEDDVKVYIDGRRIGRSELQSISVASGKHQVLMEKDGFLPIERAVSVESGKILLINAKAKVAEPSRPPNATTSEVQ